MFTDDVYRPKQFQLSELVGISVQDARDALQALRGLRRADEPAQREDRRNASARDHRSRAMPAYSELTRRLGFELQRHGDIDWQAVEARMAPRTAVRRRGGRERG